MATHWFKNSRAIALTLGTLILFVTMACGSAAAPADTAPATSDSAPVDVAQVAPTAVPEAASEPGEAMVEVHPGNVTWMMGTWGDEQFDKVYSEGASNSYGRILQAFLIETTAETELVPGMASEWGYSSDGLTWTATIRDGIKFHDGTDMTMEDVVWSLDHNFGPEAFNYTYSGTVTTFSREIAKVEQAAPNQVSVVFNEINTGFPGYLSAAGPSWGTFVHKRDPVPGQEFATVDAAQEAAYQKNPIAPGPMKYIQLIPSEVIEFERFDDYYYQPKYGLDEDRRVNFATLDLRLVPEEATRVAALRAGEADVSPVSVQAQNQVERGGGRIIWAGEGGYFRIMLMGCWSGGEREGLPDMPCADKRVRHALDYAIDRKAIQGLFGGPEAMEVDQGGWNVITPSTIGFSPDLNPPPFDPDKARALLAEAGYKTPTNPNGKDFGPLVINTWVSALMVFLPESAQLAAESWKRELGIDTEVVVGEEVAIKRAYKTRSTDGQVIWRDNETRLDAASIIGASYGNPDYKAKFHNSDDLFNLTKEAISVFDDAERPAALNNLFRRLHDERYQLSVGTINIPWAIGPDVENWEPFPVAFYPSGLHTLKLK
jgi:peptide/nickel transport system substrate-binding protein